MGIDYFDGVEGEYYDEEEEEKPKKKVIKAGKTANKKAIKGGPAVKAITY